MPAPNKLTLRARGFKSSAFILDVENLWPGNGITCKECAPEVTNMELRCSVIVIGLGGEHVYTIYQCSNCGREWAVHRWQEDMETEGE